MNPTCELLLNLDRLHTTELGVVRIKKNLSLDTEQVVDWCRSRIGAPDAVIRRAGKNWYVDVGECILTVNAYSYTIITAHKKNDTETIRSEADKALSFHAVSFIGTREDKIISIDEYWSDDGPAPQWRLDKCIGNPIWKESKEDKENGNSKAI